MVEWIKAIGSKELAVIRQAPYSFGLIVVAALSVAWFGVDLRYSMQLANLHSTVDRQDHELADYRQHEQVAASKSSSDSGLPAPIQRALIDPFGIYANGKRIAAVCATPRLQQGSLNFGCIRVDNGPLPPTSDIEYDGGSFHCLPFQSKAATGTTSTNCFYPPSAQQAQQQKSNITIEGGDIRGFQNILTAPESGVPNFSMKGVHAEGTPGGKAIEITPVPQQPQSPAK